MRELYIIRHGYAGKSLKEKVEDEKRALKKKGKEQIKTVGKYLKKIDVTFEMVLTSPLLRAKESAEILNEYCGKSKKVTITTLLKPEATYEKLIKHLNQQRGAEKIALVGHEPFLSGFASYCLSKSPSSFINLKKGGMIVLSVDELLKPGEFLLSCLYAPLPI